jgi:N-glycosylase/DNA lyase
MAAGEYRGVVRNAVFHVRQEGKQLRVRCEGGVVPLDLATFVRDYFDLSSDYPALVRRWRRDRRFAQVASPRAGIHILRQEPVEVLISFIISANNNIARIRSIIERLCQRYGSPLETPWDLEYSFPTPEALAQAPVNDLRDTCGLGYRDVYVRSAARAVATQPDFATLADLPTSALRERLRRFDGVGEKVADCILLFAFHRLEAFPIDTWIRQAMAELYFNGQMPRPRELQTFAAKRFGAYAGVAQQYLFSSYRSRYRKSNDSR